MQSMKDTMLYLCQNVQGCVFGYTQSDEITLVLTDYEKMTTDAWFGYSVQKMTSIAASMATFAFNKSFGDNATNYLLRSPIGDNDKSADRDMAMCKALESGALFDARAFSIPKEEVCNCLIWRQQDATRNSIQSVGQAYFSHRELMNKSCDSIQDMLWKTYKINQNDFPVDCKRGSCCIRKPVEKETENTDGVIQRNSWVVDNEPPIFTQDRSYIEQFL